MMRRLAGGPNETGSEEEVISRLKPVRKGSEMEIDQADGPKAKKLRQTVLSSHTMPQRRGAGPGGFKVPFKTNSSSASASKVPQETIVISDDDADIIPNSMEPRTTSSHSLDRLTPEPVLEDPYVGSSPVKFDTETGDVEAASSRKIPLQIRQETAQKLRTGLHKGLMVGLRGEDYWVKLEADNLNQNERSDVLLEAARQLEFLVWSYSVSEGGYKLRASKRLAAIRLLATSDLGSLLSTGRSSRTNDSGRIIAEPNIGPEVEKEDIDEVARILQKQVQAAFKKDGKPKGSQAVSQPNLDDGNERLRNPDSTPSISTPPFY